MCDKVPASVHTNGLSVNQVGAYVQRLLTTTLSAREAWVATVVAASTQLPSIGRPPSVLLSGTAEAISRNRQHKKEEASWRPHAVLLPSVRNLWDKSSRLLAQSAERPSRTAKEVTLSSRRTVLNPVPLSNI